LAAALLFVAVAVALSAVRPLWVDEILQLMETRQVSAAQTIADMPRTPGAAPLGYLVQQAGLWITGYSIVRARLTPALFGGASVCIVFLLAAELGLARPWIAGAVFAAFPLTLRYATESRVYSQALFFSVLATLLHVRLTKRAGWGLACGCCLALTAAAYTQPYAACLGLANVLWCVLYRNWRSARMSAVALAVAGIAFLPWFLWSKARWAASIAQTSTHFHISAATPVVIFRESTGAGYWGAGCLALLYGMAVWRRWPAPRAASLVVLIGSTVVICVLTGDALFCYFLAARQFLWILPSLAILAASAIERKERTALALATMLGIFCVRQSAVFFLAPKENWQAAADSILAQVPQGAPLIVVPAEQAPLYAFFHPELRGGRATSNRIVMAITPYATGAQRQAAIAAYLAAGYEVELERIIGGSQIVSLTLKRKAEDELGRAWPAALKQCRQTGVGRSGSEHQVLNGGGLSEARAGKEWDGIGKRWMVENVEDIQAEF
jgi:4-amino-4-deoxy-L-arabinose transferase-like glycosyltransferase